MPALKRGLLDAAVFPLRYAANVAATDRFTGME